ncbi:MAG: ThuA domain-containing protein [Verrucomicrobiaceae bacterium]|nr:ThuA domain-containing protein [Verrucomicrobiaceae bacterium]
MKFRSFLTLLAPLALAGAAAWVAQAEDSAPVKPLKVLLVCGGCCHDYATQKMLLAEGISARANVEFTIEHNPDKSTKAAFEIYKNPDWAKNFDVILHDECSADVTDPTYVGNILNAHKAGKPAVNLHCAMHSYRWGNFKEPVAAGADNAGWYEMLGLQSTGHGPQEPIDISFVDKTNPLNKNLSDWTTIKEELYNNIQVLTAKPVAKGKQSFKDKKTGEQKTAETVIVWTNEFGPNKTRIWSTTIGHNNDTVSDARYLDMVTNGLLWAVGKLDDNGKPMPGYGPRQK